MRAMRLRVHCMGDPVKPIAWGSSSQDGYVSQTGAQASAGIVMPARMVCEA